MGGRRDFREIYEKTGVYEYESVEPARVVNGVKGHLIRRRGSTDYHTQLPFFANTSDVYLRANERGICQARAYTGSDHHLFVDFDWGHEHRNKGDKRVFPVGVVHVQEWIPEGKSYRRLSNEARLMTEQEISKYGPLLKDYVPNLKFR